VFRNLNHGSDMVK